MYFLNPYFTALASKHKFKKTKIGTRLMKSLSWQRLNRNSVTMAVTSR